MSWFYFFVKGFILFFLLVPYRFVLSIPHQIEKQIQDAYFWAVKGQRRAMGKDEWQEIDLLDFGLWPPKGHPYWEKHVKVGAMPNIIPRQAPPEDKNV